MEVIAESDGYKDYKTIDPSFSVNCFESISPNPTSGNVSVSYNVQSGSNMEIELHNVSGNLLSSKSGLPVGNSSTNFNLSAQPKGIYILSLKINGELICSSSLVKQ